MSQEPSDKPLSELLKKLMAVGSGAAFLTEDVLKHALKEGSLPKDLISGLLHNAKNVKEDISGSLKDEFSKYLHKIDLTHLVDKVANDYDLEVKAKISLKPKKKTTKKSKTEP